MAGETRGARQKRLRKFTQQSRAFKIAELDAKLKEAYDDEQVPRQMLNEWLLEPQGIGSDLHQCRWRTRMASGAMQLFEGYCLLAVIVRERGLEPKSKQLVEELLQHGRQLNVTTGNAGHRGVEGLAAPQ